MARRPGARMTEETVKVLELLEKRHEAERVQWITALDRNSTVLEQLSDALQPLLEEHARKGVVDAARADLHLAAEKRWEAVMSIFSHPLTKWILGIAAALAAGSLGVRACVPVEQVETAVAGDPWFQYRPH